ncbi:MAG: type I-E CRISPR-associated protein Cas7/Cse4/CasC, partial [Anaerolineae bacterium]
AVRHLGVAGPAAGRHLAQRPIKNGLIAAGKNEEDATAVAAAFVKAYAATPDKKNSERASVLIYFSQEEIDAIVNGLLAEWETAVAAAKDGKSLPNLVKTLIKETKNRTSAPDIALFGRMLAEQPELNIDAACQVAHAISTHRINMEMDFYTAVDDLQETDSDEGAGAGMMGFTNFNSACFYRYVRLDWRQLVKNLGGDTELARRTVEGFLRAAVDAIPTGKQNSFAAQNPTSLALAVVREDGKSWNLANAFEEPVRASQKSGYIRASIHNLDSYWGDLTARRDDATHRLVAVWTDKTEHENSLSTLQDNHHLKFSAWIQAVTEALPAAVSEE